LDNNHIPSCTFAGSGLKFRRGDNSTYIFMKRGVVYLDVCSWLVYFEDGMFLPNKESGQNPEHYTTLNMVEL
jgi:hypothetical protein